MDDHSSELIEQSKRGVLIITFSTMTQYTTSQRTVANYAAARALASLTCPHPGQWKQTGFIWTQTRRSRQNNVLTKMHSTPVACHSYVYGSVKGWDERVEGGGVTWKGKVERMNGMGWGGGGQGEGVWCWRFIRTSAFHERSELRSCVKVEVAVRGSRAQELCESRGGRPGLPVPNKPTVSVDVKQHSTTNADFRELS